MNRVDLAPPAHLSEPAAVVWRATIETMANAGTLDVASLPLIERYCVQWARWRHAEDQLEAEGVIVIAPGVRRAAGERMARRRPCRGYPVHEIGKRARVGAGPS